MTTMWRIGLGITPASTASLASTAASSAEVLALSLPHAARSSVAAKTAKPALATKHHRRADVMSEIHSTDDRDSGHGARRRAARPSAQMLEERAAEVVVVIVELE